MFYRILILMLSAVLCFCSPKSETSTSDTTPPLENVLILDAGFELNRDMKQGSFILHEPLDIAVNANGEIIIPDGEILKIHDSAGTYKTILDFKTSDLSESPPFGGYNSRMFLPEAYRITVGPLGFICVSGSNIMVDMPASWHNLISPDYYHLTYESITEKNNLQKALESLGFKSAYTKIRKIIAISDVEFVYHIDAVKLLNNVNILVYDILVYEANTKIQILYQNKKTGLLATRNRYFITDALGTLHFETPDRNTIVYSHAAYDTQTENSVNKYILHNFDTETMQTKKIIKDYQPVDNRSSRIRDIPLSDFENVSLTEDDSLTITNLRDQRYRPPIARIIADGRTLFVLTWTSRNDRKEYLADVFDIADGEYIASVWLPGWMIHTLSRRRSSTIRNGFAWFLENNPMESPQVQKYRIDPSVYGK
ncbi:hypothetical protein ACFL7D_11655 [candidate division KSB1 bacterium]